MYDADWLLFIVASLALIALPGQDMILVMSRSIAQGARADTVTAAGVSVGLVGYTFLATLGCNSRWPRCEAGTRAPLMSANPARVRSGEAAAIPMR